MVAFHSIVDRVVLMAFHLVHRFGPKDKPHYRSETFSTEPEAVIRACALLAAGDKGDFIIEDDKGQIVTNDLEIRNRCKATRMP
jgi:hypothetical protein